jgi:hypothetical protein
MSEILLSDPADQAQPEKPSRQDVPTCSACHRDLDEIKSRQVAIGDVVIQLLWCGNPDCRQLLPLQVVGQVRQNRIAVPNLTIQPGGRS